MEWSRIGAQRAIRRLDGGQLKSHLSAGIALGVLGLARTCRCRPSWSRDGSRSSLAETLIG